MKYSLRSLMIVVTLGCMVGGGRIEYLRRMAVFHEKMATVKPMKLEWARYSTCVRHRKVAANYRAGCLRPWLFVNESVDVSEDEVIEEMLFGPSQ